LGKAWLAVHVFNKQKAASRYIFMVLDLVLRK